MLILFIIYILSCIRMYFWVKNAYSKGGWLEYENVNGFDFFLSFSPLINTLASVILLVVCPNGKQSFEYYNFFNKFFNIKK